MTKGPFMTLLIKILARKPQKMNKRYSVCWRRKSSRLVWSWFHSVLNTQKWQRSSRYTFDKAGRPEVALDKIRKK